jgi:hypothetical protein
LKDIVSENWDFNPLNAELNPICHLLALLGAHPIIHVSRIRVNVVESLLGLLVKYLESLRKTTENLMKIQ